MPEDPLDSFIDQKKADSPFLSLLDGESARIKSLKELKRVTKAGFSGEEIEVLRLSCVVETEFGDKAKNFDNSSAKFAKELKKNSIVVGAAFTLTRDGEGPKTLYVVSDVVLPKAGTAADVAAAKETFPGAEEVE